MEIDNISQRDKFEDELEPIKPYLKHISISNIVIYQKSSSAAAGKQVGYRIGYTEDGQKTIVMSRYGTIYTIDNYLVDELVNSPITRILNKLQKIYENNRRDFDNINLAKM